MKIQNERYTKIAIWLHWITAVLMLFMLFVGQGYMKVPVGAPFAGWKPSAHASFGVLILLLTMARLLWRYGNPPPALPPVVARWKAFAANATHWAFYGLMIAIPVTGLLALAPYSDERLDAGNVTFLRLFPINLLPNLGSWTAEVHSLLSKVTKALVIMHVVVALKHRFWNPRELSGRMPPM